MSDAADFAGEAQAVYDAELADRLERDRQARERRVGTVACIDCEDEIPLRRRQAMPWVTRCTECQEFADRLQSRHRR